MADEGRLCSRAELEAWLELETPGGNLIPFSKAHACGNDFLIVAEDAARGCDWATLTRRLCARNTGVGADGIEFFTWTGSDSGRIRLHNADGSIAEISGNGTRCVAAWMAATKAARAGSELRIETDAGLRICRVNKVLGSAGNSFEITTGMGRPVSSVRTVKLADGEEIAGATISMGNPHFVIAVKSADFMVAGRRWQEVGAEICTHPDFPQQTNVEFMRIHHPHEIEIRIFERGVGPTESSGTGTSASAAAAILYHGCASPLKVVAPGGAQTVEWNGDELLLTGSATLIAQGEAW
jgi:diaminopimelate epimerase